MMGALGLLSPFIDKALSFIPDPEQKLRAKQALEKQLLESENSFRDFVVAYEGRGDQVHPAVQILRSSVRPLITYAGFICLFVAIFQNYPIEVLEMIFKLNLLTLTFWFGSKSLERLGFTGETFKAAYMKPRIGVGKDGVPVPRPRPDS